MKRGNEKPGDYAGFFAMKRCPASLILNGFLQRILHAANGILYFTGGFLRLAFAPKLGVAGGLAGHLFYRALRLFGAALNTLFVYWVIFSLVVVSKDNVAAQGRAPPRVFTWQNINAGMPKPRTARAPRGFGRSRND